MVTKSLKPTAKFIRLKMAEENNEENASTNNAKNQLNCYRSSLKYPEYNRLNTGERATVMQFAEVSDEIDNFGLKMIHVESSVQLVFYLTMLMFNLHEVPLLELNFQSNAGSQSLVSATTKWIFGLIWLVLKTALSGYTTFSPILRELIKDSYRSRGSAPKVIQFICVIVNVMLEVTFAAFSTFLEWSVRQNLNEIR